MNGPTDSREIAAGDLPDYLRRAASAVYIAMDKVAADDLSPRLLEAANLLDRLTRQNDRLTMELQHRAGQESREITPVDDGLGRRRPHPRSQEGMGGPHGIAGGAVDAALGDLVRCVYHDRWLRARLQIVEDHICDLRCENAQLRGDLAAAYCRMDDMEGYNDD